MALSFGSGQSHGWLPIRLLSVSVSTLGLYLFNEELKRSESFQHSSNSPSLLFPLLTKLVVLTS